MTVLRRIRHRAALAYRLACARDDVRSLGLRTPPGVWFCDICRHVWFDRFTWMRHVAYCGT